GAATHARCRGGAIAARPNDGSPKQEEVGRQRALRLGVARAELPRVLRCQCGRGSPGREDRGRGTLGAQHAVHRRKGGVTVKLIELASAQPTLDEVIGLAEGELVVLRKPDGSVFALSQVDDFDVEVELLRNNPEFMAFLRQLSQESAIISLEDLRKELSL